MSLLPRQRTPSTNRRSNSSIVIQGERAIANAADQFAKIAVGKSVAQRREHHGQHLRAAPGKVLSQAIGAISQLLHCFAHPPLRALADARIVVDDQRNGRCRDLGKAGYFAHADLFTGG
jgi:hypothetical protein